MRPYHYKGAKYSCIVLYVLAVQVVVEIVLFGSLQGKDVQVVVWLLRHRLIYQVHTFVHLIPKDNQYRQRMRLTKGGTEENEDDDEEMEASKDAASIKQPSK